MKKVILSGNKPPNVAVANYLHKDWLERRKGATGFYFIDSARAAGIVLLQFAHGSANRREVIAEIGEGELRPHERREADVTHLLLMARSLRRHERSDTAAMKRAITLHRKSADKEALDGAVRSLRHWLKGQTLAQFARKQRCKYVFEPPNKFSFVVAKIRKKSRSDKHS